MLFVFLFICCVLFNIDIINVQAQNDISPNCITPDRKYGFCININNCTPLLNILLTHSTNSQIRQFLRNSRCGYEEQTPKVCCPQQKVRTTETITENIQVEDESNKLPKSPNCGFSNVTTGRIVNGVPAKLGEFPWMVALGYKNSKNPQMPKWLCGGSLITDKHILTAAHCVYNRPDLYIARLGDLDLFSDDDGANPENIPLVKAKIHEKYDPNKYTNDIAILTLQRKPSISTVWPICLPVSEPYRTMSYINFSPTLAGWGSVSFNGPSSSALQEIFVPVKSNDECERVFSKQAIIDNKIICAGSTNGNKDACGGDSGGPLMNIIYEGLNYRIYEIGIVSYGFKCAIPGYPGVYTRVTSFIDWIEENVN